MTDRNLADELARLDARRAQLRRRLEDGYNRIEAALAGGENVERWERFWLDLLDQYEALCDEGERRRAA